GTTFSHLYYAQTLKRYHFSISPALFTNASTGFTYDVTSPISPPDANAFYFLSVKYPHTYDLENASTFRLFVPDDVNGKAYMNISNFNTGGSAPVLFDLSNHKRILVSQSGNNVQALVGNDLNSSPKLC